uniref:Uncharacterized protein LOC104235647 n=1 Tax=Nicotiana sylvestris TaxID=4096 RepID=A0A1U7XLC9_NICSY|nr:PREDICTED: uncharacterized protein LOC104235647 [Nicotiana sylvestris]
MARTRTASTARQEPEPLVDFEEEVLVQTIPIGASQEQFSQLFLKKFVPITLREEYRRVFERLQQGSMIVTQYETRFVDLARHAIVLLPTERKRVGKFIDGLTYMIRLQMAMETESDISFQPWQQGGCYECGNIGHIRRHCPRLLSSKSQQDSRAIIPAPVASPSAQPARGRGQVAIDRGQTVRGVGHPVRACPRDVVQSGGPSPDFMVSQLGLRASYPTPGSQFSGNKNDEQMELPVELAKEKDQETQVKDESEDIDLEELALDVKTAFLHGDLEDTIYMDQPEGFLAEGKKDHVCQLKKSLYGLKQSPRQWYKRFDAFMTTHEFSRSAFDSCVYHKKMSGNSMIYLLLYVDDMLIAANNITEINALKKLLSKEFDMKDLGAAKKILGMEISREDDVVHLSQKRYIERVLERFNMQTCKPVSTPLAPHFKLSESQMPQSEDEVEHMSKIPYASAVGSIMYAMVCTRPDIAQSVSVVSRYMSNPGKRHWEAVKWILRYLKGASGVGLTFRKSGTGISILGYVDSDYAGDLDRRRSTTGYIFTLVGSAVSWKSTLQSIVALSTTEAEYMAAVEAVKETIWLKGLVVELSLVQLESTLRCDSQSAIHLMKNQRFHERTKHIDRSPLLRSWGRICGPAPAEKASQVWNSLIRAGAASAVNGSICGPMTGRGRGRSKKDKRPIDHDDGATPSLPSIPHLQPSAVGRQKYSRHTSIPPHPSFHQTTHHSLSQQYYYHSPPQGYTLLPSYDPACSYMGPSNSSEDDDPDEVQYDSCQRMIIRPEGNGFIPNNRVTKIIIEILGRLYNAPYPTWRKTYGRKMTHDEFFMETHIQKKKALADPSRLVEDRPETAYGRYKINVEEYTQSLPPNEQGERPPLSDEEAQRIWLDVVCSPKKGIAYGLPERSIRRYRAGLQGIGTSAQGEVINRSTISSMEQKIAKLASELEEIKVREQKRDEQFGTLQVQLEKWDERFNLLQGQLVNLLANGAFPIP